MPTVHSPENLDSWIGVLAQCERPQASSFMRAVVRSYQDGTYASLVRTSDNSNYWIKALGNPQGDQVLVTELVVSGVGELIGAPVRPTALIQIPAAFDGVTYGPEHQSTARFRAGVAHGSLHLDFAEERDEVAFLRHDHNPQRRATLAVLWDWCMGDDPQWLFDQANDYSIWSFDHGFWLGGDGGDWDSALLVRLVHHPWVWREPYTGMDPATLVECARKLKGLTAEDVLAVLARVPDSWGATDTELETLGWFLFNRRLDVAERAETKAASLTKPAGRSN